MISFGCTCCFIFSPLLPSPQHVAAAYLQLTGKLPTSVIFEIVSATNCMSKVLYLDIKNSFLLAKPRISFTTNEYKYMNYRLIIRASSFIVSSSSPMTSEFIFFHVALEYKYIFLVLKILLENIFILIDITLQLYTGDITNFKRTKPLSGTNASGIRREIPN